MIMLRPSLSHLLSRTVHRLSSAFPKTRTAVVALLFAVASRQAAAQQNIDWPVYGGSDDHTHYSTLAQITPANVKRLKVAWTYDTHDAFAGSEMQSNPS